jgi:hypothetical protein
MTTPSNPVAALSVLYFPASTETADGRPWPAIVSYVRDNSGDLDLTVFRPDGTTASRQYVISATAWATAGSTPTVAHWGYAALNPS